jgi:hypothetical protein
MVRGHLNGGPVSLRLRTGPYPLMAQVRSVCTGEPRAEMRRALQPKVFQERALLHRNDRA